MARYAYADPPYLGLAEKFYGALHPEAAVYDDPEVHRDLITRLCDEFPDGWAMSLHSPSLRQILPMCPDDVRVAAWTKPFASFKKGVNPGYAWEPVIFRGGRRRTDGSEHTVTDYCAVPITLQRGFQGAKPERFVWWVLALLGVEATDEVVDMFPGSGAVTRAIDAWRSQMTLPPPRAAVVEPIETLRWIADPMFTDAERAERERFFSQEPSAALPPPSRRTVPD